MFAFHVNFRAGKDNLNFEGENILLKKGSIMRYHSLVCPQILLLLFLRSYLNLQNQRCYTQIGIHGLICQSTNLATLGTEYC